MCIDWKQKQAKDSYTADVCQVFCPCTEGPILDQFFPLNRSIQKMHIYICLYIWHNR